MTRKAEKVRGGCRKQQNDDLHDLKRVIHVDENVVQRPRHEMRYPVWDRRSNNFKTRGLQEFIRIMNTEEKLVKKTARNI